MNFHQALAALQSHAAALEPLRARDFFARDPVRFREFSVEIDDLLFDFSKHKITAETVRLLIELARARNLEARRAALFAGEPVNNTEGRAAMHMALRDLSRRPIQMGGVDMRPEIEREREKVLSFAQSLRSGAVKTFGGERFTDVVNIGIGGSDLGPAMACRALSPYRSEGPRAHFVANVDGADLADTLSSLDLSRTLFIVSSKTFTTQETMANARSARARVVAALGEAAVAQHFAAVSTRLDKVAEFGIAQDRVFGFWDWVGGRYSLWSSIGLALAISVGPENFIAFLQGGFDVDEHFREAPLEKNIPALMGLLGVLHRNVLGRAAHAVIPYDQRLARFPAYLQQLDMESNGKSVRRDGSKVETETGPVIFGEPGTNGQHAFFQLLHQGTSVVPIDFLIAAEPVESDERHHELLFANCLAQSEALMRGRTLDEAKALLTGEDRAPEEIERLGPHKVFPGDRPSSTILYRRLDPRTLGRLVALYEHKVFVQSVIWDINPFDQWGVELGKELANRLAPIVADPSRATADLDASTAGLIGWRRATAG
ncbi:glucose-6-phosphate isomerase [Methylocystis bryophila]|uniref:Glucose-6-phosphate isomerase n=1 Tax=Methylocystis bryophila TaxID=655015 RepID=A0A1W6MRK8_9HYPH|nr:glucose-6-phosphate isomerase [Methylocystis bryophila]ARN80251.1 glucose-6-phosphate isomerase [Methylocystis bryophila]BDV40211.1 glucose-6-phosphate isomerase [Methylocystis bryophila]